MAGLCSEKCPYLYSREEEYDDEPMGYCSLNNDRFVGSMDNIRTDDCYCLGMSEEEARGYLKRYFEDISVDELLELCNEFYDYKYISGMLNPVGKVNSICERTGYWDICEMERMVLKMAHREFKFVVPLLFADRPKDYLSFD